MKKKIAMVVIIIAIIAAIIFAWWRNEIMTAAPPKGIASANGRLELKRYDVATLHSGKVAQVLIHEGDSISKGETLATLSSDEMDAKLAAAQADKSRALASIAQVESQQQRAHNSVSAAQAEITARQAQLAIAENDLKNARTLRQQRLISPSELYNREQSAIAASAALSAAKASELQAQSGENEASAGIKEAQAAAQAAQAQIDAVQAYLNNLRITSPIAGRVQYRVAQPGNVVASGAVVATIMNPTDASLAIYLPTETVGKMKIGNEARIKIDGINAVFPAEITFIANNAQFTPKFVETQSERDQLMYRVKAKIPTDIAKKYANLLKDGMTAVGYVKTDNTPWPANLAVTLPSDK